MLLLGIGEDGERVCGAYLEFIYTCPFREKGKFRLKEHGT